MKIVFKTDNKPLAFDPSDGSINGTQDSRIYISLSPQQKLPNRHQGELVLRNGWIHLDYDQEGFLVGMEIVEGDPITGVTECIPYLQPVNPLVQ